MSGARPMEIVASTALISVSNVFVLFHYLLWKAKLDLIALNEGLDSWSINVSFSMGSIASCGVMKTLSCIIRRQWMVNKYSEKASSPKKQKKE